MLAENSTREQRELCEKFQADRRKLTSQLRGNNDQYDLLQSRLLQEQRLLDDLNRQIDRTGDPAGFQQQLSQLDHRALIWNHSATSNLTHKDDRHLSIEQLCAVSRHRPDSD